MVVACAVVVVVDRDRSAKSADKKKKCVYSSENVNRNAQGKVGRQWCVAKCLGKNAKDHH